MDFIPLPPPPETGLYYKHCTRKPQVRELSRFCPETSTKLYVDEFDFGVQVLLFIEMTPL